MLRDYDDIKTRLGEPLWWDDNGVPRYDAFKPDMCGVYDRMVALVEIACQDCGLKFNVAITYDPVYSFRPFNSAPSKKELFYGDPPIHGCIGDTMTTDTIRVIEYWIKNEKSFNWERKTDQEGIIDEKDFSQ